MTAQQTERIERLRELAKAYAKAIINTCPAGPKREKALEHLTWANLLAADSITDQSP